MLAYATGQNTDKSRSRLIFMLFTIVYVHISTFRLVGIRLVLGLELEILVCRTKEHLPVQPR